MSDVQINITRHAKKEENLTHNVENNQPNPNQNWHIELAEKDIQKL